MTSNSPQEETKTGDMKPKKLIRKFITKRLIEGEWETIADQDELNSLYAIKVREELAEIQEAGHKDIMEFVDLIQVAFSFARENGFSQEELSLALIEKSTEKGTFGRLALNNLNPDNPSNKLYFQHPQVPDTGKEKASDPVKEQMVEAKIELLSELLYEKLYQPIENEEWFRNKSKEDKLRAFNEWIIEQAIAREHYALAAYESETAKQ